MANLFSNKIIHRPSLRSINPVRYPAPPKVQFFFTTHSSEAMLSHAITPLISEQDYLAMEMHGDVRHEYIDGYVFAMTGASRRHNQIAINLVSIFHQHIKNTPCRIYMSDVKLKIAHRKTYYYPDIMLGCSRDETDEYALTRPCLIIEVLSDFTASTDRREKLVAYQSIPSVREYCLAAQDNCRIEKYTRTEDEKNGYLDSYEQGDNVPFVCIDADIAMDAIYADSQ